MSETGNVIHGKGIRRVQHALLGAEVPVDQFNMVDGIPQFKSMLPETALPPDGIVEEDLTIKGGFRRLMDAFKENDLPPT